MCIKAVAHISQVRGGSQARIMRADDGKKYVVKFMGNPQCTRVLANDYLACRLARMIGLSVPEPVIILVDEKTILDQQITFTLAGRAVAARPGLQFGSALVTGEVLDWLPGTMLGRVRNLREFAGLLAFDKWTGNADGRQVVFHKKIRERKYNASFIDFGYCFNAGEWSFPDAPLRGVYGLNDVYERIESWDDFDPWQSRIERFSRTAAAEHCGRDSMRVVWRTRRTATLTGSLVGTPQHGTPANRRLQEFQQKPVSELDHDNFAARYRVPEFGYLLTNAIM